MSRRIRIAFILPHLRPGGAERVIVNYLRALDRERFEPFLFLARAEGAFLDLLPNDVVRGDFGGTRARQLPRRIADALRTCRIDVAYSATDAMNLALVASRWWGVGQTRRIVSVHTTPAEWLAEARHPRLRRALMRLLYPRADLVAVPTAAIAGELRTIAGVTAAVLPNPVIERMRQAASRGRRIVAAGRLVEPKGFDLLIEAAAILVRRGIAIELVIHGEGPLRLALERQAATLGVSGCIFFAGHTADQRALFEDARLCVVPSRREGFGNVVVEAMAAGVPVLASACPGPAALIENGRNGFLVEPENSAALADAMAALLADDRRLQSVVEDGMRTAAGFDVGSATRRIEEEVQRLAR